MVYPLLLAIDQELTRKAVSIENLALYERNSSEFLRLFISVYETWIHHYSRESKQQWKQLIGVGEPTPKKATMFWAAKGIIFFD